jgi:hypothetical protein
MRTTSLKMLLGLLLVILCTFNVRPASAQTFQIGTCTGADAFTFTPGLTTTPATQNFVFQAIFTGCVYVTNLLSAPVPAYATWNSSVADGGCLTLNTNPSPGTGTLTWSDKSTSTFELTGAPVSIGVTGLSPTAAFFYLESGTGAGGYFVANTELLPSVASLTCSNSNPLYILTGINVPIYVALPISGL